MHLLRSIRRVALGAAVAGAAIGAVATAPAMAANASKCTYDPVTRTATVTVDDSGANSLVIKRGGTLINVDSNQLCISSGFEFASVTNTDRIDVNTIVTDRFDGVTLDMSSGAFAPGSTPEADGNSEMEIVVSKAGGFPGQGTLRIIGTPQGDVIRMAEGGRINFGVDDDTDVRHPPTNTTVLGGDGPDYLAGDGYSGRRPTLSGLNLDGGVGEDTLIGGTQGDLMFGGDDRDTLRSVDLASDVLGGGDGFDNAIHDARDQVIDVESPTQSSLGRLRLAPHTLRVRAGETARLTMGWRHPKAWRELRSVALHLYDGANRRVATVATGPRGLTSHGTVNVTAGSRVIHHGKWVTAKLAMRLPRWLAGQNLRLAVQATDRRGHRQVEPDAGSIRITQ